MVEVSNPQWDRVLNGAPAQQPFGRPRLRCCGVVGGLGERVAEMPTRAYADRLLLVVAGPASTFDRILQQGRKGLVIQRFKGLGEMNPEQLWKTTLDPSVRTLLQVRVGDAENAAEVFSTLMGDVVEPRRDFIVGNALKVANLDV
jgi:DNA gyrase subunit B